MQKLIITLFMFVLTETCLAGILEANIAFEKKDYQLVLTELKPLLKKGDKDAELLMGIMYSKGKGVKQNNKLAFEYFTQSSNKGNSAAYANLGLLYFYGNGVTQNYEKAFTYIKKSNFSNSAFLQGLLGQMYFEGKGVNKNKNEAIKLLTFASNNNDLDSQTYLGVLYIKEMNYTEGFKFLSLAENNPQFNIENKDSLNKLDVYMFLGSLYHDGLGVPQNFKKSLTYYFKYFAMQPQFVSELIGLQYYYGQGVPQNYEKAFYYLNYNMQKPDLELVSSDILVKLGYMYFYGNGVAQNYVKASEMFKYGILKGNVIAQKNLATMYLLGKGVKQNIIIAYALVNLSEIKTNNNKELINETQANIKEQLMPLMTQEQIEIAQNLSLIIKNNRSNIFRILKKYELE